MLAVLLLRYVILGLRGSMFGVTLEVHGRYVLGLETE